MAGCRFVAVGPDVQSQTLPPDDPRWLIVIQEGETRESVVAHEIAHAWLGHARFNATVDEFRPVAPVCPCGPVGPIWFHETGLAKPFGHVEVLSVSMNLTFPPES